MTGCAYAANQADYEKASPRSPRRSTGSKRRWRSRAAARSSTASEYSLVDAAYAPFLQRYVFLDRIKPIGQMEKYPRLKAWCDALMARPSTHSFPEAEFEAMYREGLRKRGSYLSQFVEPARQAAE